MAFAALRSLALDLNLWAHGVDIEVSLPDVSTPVTTRGIWLTQQTNDAPPGSVFGRREPHRVLAVSRSVVTTLSRGMRIVAPEQDGGTARRWLVDAVESVQVDHWRAVMVPEPE